MIYKRRIFIILLTCTFILDVFGGAFAATGSLTGKIPSAWFGKCSKDNCGSTTPFNNTFYGQTNMTTSCGTGYTAGYDGWTSSTFQVSSSASAVVTCDPNTITLSWNNGGHGTVPTAAPTSCTYNNSFNVPSMSVTGYNFGGWKVGSTSTILSEGTKTCNQTNLSVASGSVTLTAQWTPVESKVVLKEYGMEAKALYTKYNTGVYIDEARTQSVSAGDTVITPNWNYLYTITCNAGNGSVSPTSQNVGTLQGFYSSDDANATKCVGADGKILQAGINIAKTYTTTSSFIPWPSRYGSTTVTLPAPTAPNGYSFGGWYTAADCGGDFVGNAGVSYTVSADITLHACWTANTYTVTLDKNSSTATNGSVTTIYEKYGTGYYKTNNAGTLSNQITTSDGLSSTELPSNPGYTFGGYYACANATGNSGCEQIITSDGKLTSGASTTLFTSNSGKLYAKWIEKPRTMIVLTEIGQQATALYTIYDTGVYKDEQRTQPVSVGDTVITPHFTHKYTITYNANGGSVSPASEGAGALLGFYSSDDSNATKCVDADGKILSNGITVAKANTTNTGWPSKYDTNTTVTLPTPTRSDYVLNGWYTTDTGGTKVGNAGDSYSVTSSTTLYAQWAQAVCNTGTGVQSATPSVNSSNQVVCAVVCKDGYSQTGGTDTTTSFNTNPSNNSTVNTSCQARSYTVTYSCGTGSGTPPTSGTAIYNSNFTPAAKGNCSKTGYNFAGWKVSDTTAVKPAGTGFTWTYTTNKTFTAEWIYNCPSNAEPTEDSCVCNDSLATYNGNECVCIGGYHENEDDPEFPCIPNHVPLNYLNGGHGNGSATEYCDYGGTFTARSAFNATGYSFDKWVTPTNYSFNAGETDIPCNESVLGDGVLTWNTAVNITATWTADEYPITYGAVDGNDISYAVAVDPITGHPNATSYTYEDNVKLYNPLKVGHDFGGWCKYTSAPAANTVCTTPTINPQTNDATATIAAITAGTETGARWFYANWNAVDYTVTYDCGAGSGTHQDVTQTFGTTFTVKTDSANCSKTGYHFVGWACKYLDGNGNAPHTDLINGTTYSIAADALCVAQWEANVITLQWNNDNGTTGTDGAQSCSYGGLINPVQTVTRNGYNFVGWDVVAAP